jgi:hypothetical protein
LFERSLLNGEFFFYKKKAQCDIDSWTTYKTVTLLEMQSGMVVRSRLLQLYSRLPSDR